MVDLQCCFSFRCAAKSMLYIHPFFRFVSPIGHYRVLKSSPCYTVSPWLSILYIVVCIYINPNIPIYPSLFLLPLGNHKSVFYIYKSICSADKFICILCLVPHITNIICLSLSSQWHSLGPIHIALHGIISFFFIGNIPLHYVPHLLYPFFCWWTFRLLPCPRYCIQCCSERFLYFCIHLKIPIIEGIP